MAKPKGAMGSPFIGFGDEMAKAIGATVCNTTQIVSQDKSNEQPKTESAAKTVVVEATASSGLPINSSLTNLIIQQSANTELEVQLVGLTETEIKFSVGEEVYSLTREK